MEKLRDNIWTQKGNCLELMKQIPDGKIDFILTDPPYGTTACKWDTVIPFEPMWEQLNRIIKPNGAIALFSSQPFTSALVMSNPKDFKYDWCWKKPKGTGHLNAKKQPMRDKEDICLFYKTQCTYNPQWSWGEPYSNLKSGKGVSESKAEVSGKYMNGAGFRNGSDGRRYPKTIIEFGVVERGTVHPTQKPVDLLEYLVKTYTNESELVLDFTAGSFSTGIACLNTNRKFIGFELEDKYYEIGKERLINHII